jgi:ABC-type transport system involved in multi-copper enzyme maturation permease subunit
VKYLAILRDSFRESLDSKVLYVTWGLAALVILFVAGIKIRPITMKEELEARASQLQFLFRAQSRQPDLSCTVEDFQQTNTAAEPWNGDYRFTFVMHVPMPPGAGKGGNVPQGMRPLLDETVTKQLAPFIEAFFWRLNITDIRSESKAVNEFRIKVTSVGTKVTHVRDWNHEPVLFFGALPVPWLISSPAYMVYWIENRLVNTIFGWVIVLLGIVATASFIPTMMRKGSVDLLLSKPVTRARLLIFKYLGGLTFVFLTAGLLILIVWVNLGLRSGIWAWGFLLTIPLLTFFFAILYAFSALAAVLTRSTVVCILLTCCAWFVLWLVGLLYGLAHPDPRPTDSARAKLEAAQQRDSDSDGLALPGWASTSLSALYHGLPRTRDLSRLTTRLLSRDLLSEEERRAEEVVVPEPESRFLLALGSSLIWIVGLLGLACWLFSRRDY